MERTGATSTRSGRGRGARSARTCGASAVEADVGEFLASMPERYRREFDPSIVRQHARIAADRGRLTAHAGLFGERSGTDPGLCVVAADGPGLLAAISAALLLEGFDIVRADAYTRRLAEQGAEAVDLFWVRRLGSPGSLPLNQADALAVRTSVVEVLGKGGRHPLRPLPVSGFSAGAAETRVRFTEPPGVPWLSLELESNDRPGLLSLVTSVLFAEGVQIVGSRIRTHGSRVHDWFDLLELDGSPIAGTRLQRIQLAVLVAVDAPAREH